MKQNYLNARGRIFNIQRYSIHDGPGIRTIVFLKGCPLRCRWCCNPESQKHEIQQMREENGKDKIVGRDVTVREVIREVEKDRAYYYRSGGGMTLSGGESLLQPDFAPYLLEASHAVGINTAIETTGFARFDVIEKYLPHLDYVLMDIKHINDMKHKAFTSQSNRLILENARKIAEWGANLTIRIPVIPTFNDTEEEIYAIASFAASLPHMEHLHLLPYHRLGEGKYEKLGRNYTMAHIQPMSKEKEQRLLHAAQRSGLQCQIGG